MDHTIEGIHLRWAAGEFAMAFAKQYPECLKLDAPGAVSLGRLRDYEADNTGLEVASFAKAREYWLSQGYTEKECEETFSNPPKGYVLLVIPKKEEGRSSQKKVLGYRVQYEPKEGLYPTWVADEFFELSMRPQKRAA